MASDPNKNASFMLAAMSSLTFRGGSMSDPTETGDAAPAKKGSDALLRKYMLNTG